MKVSKTFKRILSFTLCVILCLSSLLTSIATVEWPNAGAINLTKTATPVDGVDNQWDITLTIEGKNITTTSDVIFVIDTSGSMNDNSKLSTMKTGVNNAIDSIMKDSAVRVAYVTFAETATKSSFYDYSKKADLKTAVNKITATGGTNIQAGLKAARELLATSTADNKYVIVVGDGEPTYSYKVTGATTTEACTSKTTTTGNGKNQKTTTTWTHALTLNAVTSVNYNTQVGKGSAFELSSSDYYTEKCSHSTSCNVVTTNGSATIYEAGLVKATGAEILTMAVSAGTNGEAVLKACASKDDYYFSATASNMVDKLATIASHIKYAATVNAGLGVVDPMGEYFDLVGNASNITVSQGSFTYDAKTETINWMTGNIVEGTPATMTYRVTVDPNKVGEMNPDTAYPTNKTTTFNYIDVNGNTTSKDFVVPKVSISKGTIVVNGYLVNEAGQPINSDGVVVEGPQYAAKVFEPYNVKENDKTALEYKTYTINPDKYLDSTYEYVNYVIVDGNVHGSASSFDVSVTKKVPSQVVYVGYKKVTTADYTIEYYKGSVNGTKLGTDVKAGTIGSDISLTSNELSAYAPLGYVTPGVIADGSATVVDIDSSKNIVKVVYATKASYNYTINYYKDSISAENKLGDSVVKSAEYGQQVPTDAEFGARLPEGYKIPDLMPIIRVSEIAENNVINIVYSKDNFGYTIEYYIDSISSGIKIGTVKVKSAEFKSAISVDLSLYAPTGYAKPGTIAEGTPEVLADNSQVIKVLYVKDNFGYTINYYTDEVNANNLITSTTNSAEFESTITVPDLDTLPTGYTVEGKIVTGATIVTEVTANNVVNVVYKKASFDYTINYYQDSIDGTLLNTVSNSAEYASLVEVLLTGYAPEGYIVEGTVVNGNLIDGKLVINTTGNVVDVVYTKDSFDYVINYYADFVSEDTLVWSIADEAEFGSTVKVALEGFAPVGYRAIGTVENGNLTNGNLIISITGNVVDVVYAKDNFNYIINYYKDSVSTSNHIDSISSSAEFGSTVDVSLVGYAPIGYRALGTVANGTLTDGKLTISTTGNVVDVVYTKDDFKYTVKYYKDEVSSENEIGSDEFTAEFNSDIVVNDTKYVPTGYATPGIVNGNLVVNEDNEQVITVLYSTKNLYNYVINYYADEVSTLNKLASISAVAEFGSTVDVALEGYAPVGYIALGTVANGTLTDGKLTINTTGNVVDVVYTKDVFGYTVVYYVDAALPENELGTEGFTAEFGSEITVDDTKYLPDGYNAPGIVNGNLTVTADDSQVITVVYNSKKAFNYEVNYYVDSVSGDNLLDSVSGTADFGTVIGVDLTLFAPKGYITSGTVVNGTLTDGKLTINTTGNVIDVVYTKNTFKYTIKYYKDEISIFTQLGEDKQTAEYGSAIVVDASKYAPVGYTTPGIVGGTLIVTDDDAQVITVLYSTKNVYNYTINYYADSISAENKIGDSVIKSAEYGQSITVDSMDIIGARRPEGYKLPESIVGIEKISEIAENNVINIVYTKNNFNYKVEYYRDSVSDNNYLGEVKASGEFNSAISVDLNEYAPIGYVTPGTIESGNLVVSVDNNQVIKVLYVKSEFGYIINYYTDEISADSLITSTSDKAEFGSVIIVPELDTLPTGYKAEGKEISGATVVTEVTANNVVNVVYKRDSFGYTINYYRDEVATDNLLNYVAKTAEFGSLVDVALEGFAPEGYKAEGTVVNGILTEGKLLIEVTGNVIDIVYAKDTFGYTINYYTDEVADANLVGTVEDFAEFGSTINVDATLFAPDGYITPGTVLDGVKTVTVEGTVINVVYEAEEVEEITTDPTPLDDGEEETTQEITTEEETTTEEIATEEITTEETTEEETAEEVEEIDVDEIPLDNGPKTGDSTNWIILLGLAMISAGVVGVVTKKKKIED